MGSLITIAVMLEEATEGGVMQFPNYHENLQLSDERGFPQRTGTVTVIPLRRGDAVVYPSAKYHRIEPVRKGFRRTLVIELWDGRNSTDDHRCDTKRGDCCHCSYGTDEVEEESDHDGLGDLLPWDPYGSLPDPDGGWQSFGQGEHNPVYS